MASHLARLLSVLLLLLFALESNADQVATKLLRFPDIHQDTVVFVYAGDLWRVSSKGGDAVRVTAHPGIEVFPKISPDGKYVAFTGQYDGDEQVYVVPTAGGVPKQLTFYPAHGPLPDRWGFDNQVYGWSPDGKSVLFRSMRYAWGTTDTRLFTISVDGGLPQPLPMKVSGAGDFSPDGKSVVFSPLTRDFRTWKRYEGGWAQDLYTMNLDSKKTQQITVSERTDRDPMWIGDRIYFSSDRSDTLNLYYYDTKNQNTTQVTASKDGDVRWPSKGELQVVYELDGELHVLDTKEGVAKKIDVVVPTDGVAARPRTVDGEDFVFDGSVGPTGKRIALDVRGDIISLPIEHGAIRNLTRNTSGSHEKDAAWSPDGTQLAFISDRSGEEQIYLIDSKGRNEPQQLTDSFKVMLYGPSWSPAGDRLLFSNKDGEVYVLDVESKKLTKIADEARGQVGDMVWSPHGGHVALSLSDETGMRSIYIWTASDQKLSRITGEVFGESEPTFDPNGEYLYYLSDREFAPQIGSFDWDYVTDRETYIYALALRFDVEHPYPLENDEAGEEDEDDDDEEEEDSDNGDSDSKADKKSDDKDEEDDDDEEEEEPIKIDFDGLADRVARVPVEADNYTNLNAIEDHLIYVRTGPFYYGRSSDVEPEIMVFSHEDREATSLAESGDYSLNDDGSLALVWADGEAQVYELPDDDEPQSVSAENVVVDIVPQEEWQQIFDEVWRRFRDFFYVENMHGYDWEALRDKYRPLLKHVAHRSDLNYLIGEMIGELNVGHAYKAGGDFEQPKRTPVALLGAILEFDQAVGRYKISKIYRGHNEEDRYRSPLTEIGVGVEEGDYLLAIDGAELNADDNPYRFLRNKAGQPVELTVGKTASVDEARDVIVNPVRDESNLVYLNMVLDNRDRVAKATNGRVGYIHLPDMGGDGIREFNKWFYGQLRKDGLVIDVRSNGGGNVSQMIIERLRRKLLATGYPRTNDTPNTYPDVCFHGHLVCLLDEDSASDGDIFPAMFKKAELGPLIGKRSWGGVIGITNRGTLIDGGTVFVPEFGFLSAEGEWIIEGHGVEPDIKVENDPKSMIEGKDPQLERGIEEIMTRVKSEPRRLPTRPAPPVKTK